MNGVRTELTLRCRAIATQTVRDACNYQALFRIEI